MPHFFEVVMFSAYPKAFLSVGNISVGSFFTTIGADGTMIWFFDLKNSKKVLLISFAVILSINI